MEEEGFQIRPHTPHPSSVSTTLEFITRITFSRVLEAGLRALRRLQKPGTFANPRAPLEGGILEAVLDAVTRQAKGGWCLESEVLGEEALMEFPGFNPCLSARCLVSGSQPSTLSEWVALSLAEKMRRVEEIAPLPNIQSIMRNAHDCFRANMASPPIGGIPRLSLVTPFSSGLPITTFHVNKEGKGVTGSGQLATFSPPPTLKKSLEIFPFEAKKKRTTGVTLNFG